LVRGFWLECAAIISPVLGRFLSGDTKMMQFYSVMGAIMFVMSLAFLSVQAVAG